MELATDLYDSFAQSAYGQDMRQKTRFNVFKPEWVSTELWCDILGPDVNNLEHMLHTHDLTDRFCFNNEIDGDTTDTLLRTAATHDIGEAIIGDIALPNKTDEDEKREKVAYRKIVTQLFGERGEELTDEVWSVLEKTDKHKGEMFRAIEYIGYCTTAMRAGAAAVRIVHGLEFHDVTRDQKDQLVGSLLGLEKAVSVLNYPTLAGYVKLYPPITRQLR
jgi:hypothetical protein